MIVESEWRKVGGGAKKWGGANIRRNAHLPCRRKHQFWSKVDTLALSFLTPSHVVVVHLRQYPATSFPVVPFACAWNSFSTAAHFCEWSATSPGEISTRGMPGDTF